MTIKNKQRKFTLEELFPEAKLFKNPEEIGYTQEVVGVYNDIMNNFNHWYRQASHDLGSELSFSVRSRKITGKYAPEDRLFWKIIDNKIDMGQLLSRNEVDLQIKSIYEKGIIQLNWSGSGQSETLGGIVQSYNMNREGKIILNNKPYHSSIKLNFHHSFQRPDKYSKK
ncbi:hypothetical protein KAI04_00150 [Candidatus Pacearchaeota archaeon]|nr:hypothetical protein [Candidatus Pacearchaeota archaeon]